MNLLLPTAAPADERFWSEAWPAFTRHRPLPPFADVTLTFLDAFSKKILLDPALRSEIPFAALAHWARRAHLQTFRGQGAETARGLVLHLSPANVDTLFAFSWFTSLLCGNLNIVRISARSLPAIAPLLATLRTLLAEPRFDAICQRTLLVSYEHDDALTTRLSAAAHARLIWGGDDTVRTIRALPLPATALELAFADRFSLAAFDAAHVHQLDDDAIGRLATDFFNDAFQFGQKACASPRVVVFTGQPDVCRAAAGRFWPVLEAVVRSRAAHFGEADGIARLASAMALAASAPGAKIAHRPADGSPPLVLYLPRWTDATRALHDGAGLFVQLELPDLDALAPLLTPRDQTLVTAGYTRESLREFSAALPARSLDRIVSPGRALDFDPVAWDGHNLFRLLTRSIELPRL